MDIRFPGALFFRLQHAVSNVLRAVGSAISGAATTVTHDAPDRLTGINQPDCDGRIMVL
jgi:hypothetical protein